MLASFTLVTHPVCSVQRCQISTWLESAGNKKMTWALGGRSIECRVFYNSCSLEAYNPSTRPVYRVDELWIGGGEVVNGVANHLWIRKSCPPIISIIVLSSSPSCKRKEASHPESIQGGPKFPKIFAKCYLLSKTLVIFQTNITKKDFLLKKESKSERQSFLFPLHRIL